MRQKMRATMHTRSTLKYCRAKPIISGFLRKPFKPEDVKELINRVMWGQDERRV